MCFHTSHRHNSTTQQLECTPVPRVRTYVVNKHGPEVADDVDDPEHEPVRGHHSEVRPALVAADRPALLPRLLEGAVAVSGRDLHQLLVHDGGGAELAGGGVDDVDEETEDEVDEHTVEVGSQEGRLQRRGGEEERRGEG